MKFLRKFFDLDSGQRIEHPILGEAVYVQTKQGASWEFETEINDQSFTLIIDAIGQQQPTPAQVAFFLRFSERPQLAFDIAASALAAAYERWTRTPLSDTWQDELRFVGMTIPSNADPNASFELSFEGPPESNSPHFACTVKEGRTVAVDTST